MVVDDIDERRSIAPSRLSDFLGATVNSHRYDVVMAGIGTYRRRMASYYAAAARAWRTGQMGPR
jgi:hypothetical protein